MHKPIAITPQNSTAPRMISLRHVCQNEFMRDPLPGQGPPPYWHVVREFARCCFGSGAGGGNNTPGRLGPPGGIPGTASLYAAGSETPHGGAVELQSPRGRARRASPRASIVI